VVEKDDSDSEDEWEDCEDEEMQDESKPKGSKTEVWDDKKDPIKEGEEMEYDGSAYEMLHRCKVEWPCLSIDFLLRERTSSHGPANPKSWFPSQVNGQLAEGETIIDKFNRKKHRNDKFPMTAYMVAGSQAEKKTDNKLYVMKWSEMFKTVNEDDVDSDSDDSDSVREPIIRYEVIPHRGAINRVRSMHGSSIVATWNEEAEVGIYNIAPALNELEQPQEVTKKPQPKKVFGNTKVA
jgi:ribosome assembly protein RRB1